MIPRFLNLQGMIGIAAALLLATLAMVKAGEARHWRKQSGRFEQLYRAELVARAETVANYRSAAEAARKADLAHAGRVAAEQRAISERTEDDLQARLVDARARAQRLQLDARPAAAERSGRAAAVPAAAQPPGAAGRAAAQDRFSLSAKDLTIQERLIATEQAIQLDELIKWVGAQSRIESADKP